MPPATFPMPFRAILPMPPLASFIGVQFQAAIADFLMPAATLDCMAEVYKRLLNLAMAEPAILSPLVMCVTSENFAMIFPSPRNPLPIPIAVKAITSPALMNIPTTGKSFNELNTLPKISAALAVFPSAFPATEVAAATSPVTIPKYFSAVLAILKTSKPEPRV